MNRKLIVLLILAVLVVLALILSQCVGDPAPGPVVSTTKPTTTVTIKPTTTTKPKPKPPTTAETKYKNNIKAIKLRLDKAGATLKTQLAAVKNCHTLLNRVKPPSQRVLPAGYAARQGCIAAGGAESNFRAAIKYTAQHDKAGRAAVKRHTNAGLNYLTKAKTQFAAAAR